MTTLRFDKTGALVWAMPANQRIAVWSAVRGAKKVAIPGRHWLVFWPSHIEVATNKRIESAYSAVAPLKEAA